MLIELVSTAFFRNGDEKWNSKHKVGKIAELGCVGCGWYDIVKWRDSLNK